MVDTLSDFLEFVNTQGLAVGRLRGLFHICIGRTIRNNEKIISEGVTWRELAKLLKHLKYEKSLGNEVNVDSDDLNPKDRERYWYAVIALAQPDSVTATTQAQELANRLQANQITIDGFTTLLKPKLPRKSRSKPKDEPSSSDDEIV